MKRFISVIFISLLMAGLFAQEKIGTAKNENVYYLNMLKNKTPFYCYYKDKNGYVSQIREKFICIGNKEFGPYSSIKLDYTDDAVYYYAEKKGKWAIYKNGKQISENFDAIANFYISNEGVMYYCYSKDGQHYIQNGSENYGPYEKISGINNLPNTIICFTYKNDSWSLFYDNKIYEDIGPKSSYKVYNGKLYYISQKNNKQYINNESGMYFKIPFDEDIKIELLDFSPEKNNLLYTTTNGKTKKVWINKLEVFEAEDITNINFIGEESIIFSYCDSDGNWYVKDDDMIDEPLSKVYSITVSNDMEQIAIAYADTEGKAYLRIGEEITGPHGLINNVLFSPDGTKLTYELYNMDFLLMINNEVKVKRESILPHFLFPHFSEDSKDWVCLDHTLADLKWIIVLENYISEKKDYVSIKKFKNGIISFLEEKDKANYEKLLFNNQEYTGSFTSDGTGYVYIDGENIYYKKF